MTATREGGALRVNEDQDVRSATDGSVYPVGMFVDRSFVFKL